MDGTHTSLRSDWLFSLDMESKVHLSNPYLFSFFLINSLFYHAAPVGWRLIKDLWLSGLFFTLCHPCIFLYFHPLFSIILPNMLVMLADYGTSSRREASVFFNTNSITSNPVHSLFY